MNLDFIHMFDLNIVWSKRRTQQTFEIDHVAPLLENVLDVFPGFFYITHDVK